MNKKENGKAAELRDRLKEAMLDKDMKPIELSNLTGIPKSMVSYYLAGRSIPKADRVYEIAKVLGVSEAWLMGYDVPRDKTPEQKKNDDLVKVIAQLRKDSDFFEVVSLLAELSPEQYASVKTILAGLAQK